MCQHSHGEKVRAHEANGDVICTPRPMGRCRNQPGRYFLRGAWGYLDNPDASEFVIGTVVPVLGLTTPTLFLGGLICLYSWLGRGAGPLQRTGLLVGLLGTMLGVINGLDWGESGGWWTLLCAGLTAVGVGMVVEDASRLLQRPS